MTPSSWRSIRGRWQRKTCRCLEAFFEAYLPRDMSNLDLPWPINGQISPEVSVAGMIDVIQSKGIQHSGTFWTWENMVSGHKPQTASQVTFADSGKPHPW